MKKISVILLSISIIFFCCFNTAKSSYADSGSQGDETVLRVLSDGVYFYSFNTFLESDKLFELTKTYFLTGVEGINDMGVGYYFVRYKKDTPMEIMGYVKKSDVTVYDQDIPSLIYPEISATCQSTLQFLYTGTFKPKFSAGVTSLECYGKITSNNVNYALVYYSGPVNSGPYYVNLNDLTYIEPAAHPIPVQTDIVPDDGGGDAAQNPQKTPSNANEIVQIIIISAIVVFALLVVYLMFKPGNLKYQKPKDQ